MAEQKRIYALLAKSERQALSQAESAELEAAGYWRHSCGSWNEPAARSCSCGAAAPAKRDGTAELPEDDY